MKKVKWSEIRTGINSVIEKEALKETTVHYVVDMVYNWFTTANKFVKTVQTISDQISDRLRNIIFMDFLY